MQCEEWADANSELFKEAHDETVHKNSYKRKLYELISASLEVANSAECLAGLKQHIASSAANPCFPLRGRPAQRERVVRPAWV